MKSVLTTTIASADLGARYPSNSDLESVQGSLHFCVYQTIFSI